MMHSWLHAGAAQTKINNSGSDNMTMSWNEIAAILALLLATGAFFWAGRR
jgi:hypothetical protein